MSQISALLSFLGPLLSAGQQDQQAAAANRATRDVQNQAFRLSDEGFGEQLSILRQLGLDTANTGKDLVSGFQGLEGDALKMSGENRDAGMAGYRQLLGDVMGELDGLGKTGHERIDRDFGNAESAAMQDLIDRGMVNTGNLPSLRISTARDKTEAHGGLDEQLRRERSAARQTIGGNALNFMVNSDLNRLGTMLNTRGNTLGAVDTANTRNLDILGRASALSGANTGQKLSILQAPYALPEGPPPANWGDALSAGFNNWTAYRAANQQPQTDYTPAWISAGSNLAGTGIMTSVLGGAFG